VRVSTAVGAVVSAVKRQAFLVGAIDTKDGRFVGFGVFSEDRPTIRASLFPFTMLEGTGETYEDALVDLGLRLTAFEHKWMTRHIDARSLRTLHDAKRRRGSM